MCIMAAILFDFILITGHKWDSANLDNTQLLYTETSLLLCIYHFEGSMQYEDVEKAGYYLSFFIQCILRACYYVGYYKNRRSQEI